jgi:AcrR family transcriptional regulator
VGRHIDTDRRAALLEAAATHLIDHGVVQATLDSIARTAGTTSRMLVHHFGTRDALIAGALEIARQRQLRDAQDHFVPGPDAAAVLESAWSWFVHPQTRKYFRLFQQVAALERLRGPASSTDLYARLATDWKPMFQGVFAADPRHRDHADALVELLLAVYRGLAIELAIQPDETHLLLAYEHFIYALRSTR